MKKAGFILLVIVCSVLFFGAVPSGAVRPGGAPVRAGANRWTALGPDGACVPGLVRNPKLPSELFAVTSFGLLYRSGDNGASWTLRSRVSESSQSNFLDLAIDPLTPSTLYALDTNAVYKSVDKGAKFARHPFPANTGSQGRLAIHPVHPRIVYVAGMEWYGPQADKYRLAALKSADGGETWSVHKIQTATDAAYAMDIVIAPASPAILYACGSSHNPFAPYYTAVVFRSSDGGVTWRDVTPDFMRSQLHTWAVAVDPTNPNRAYVTFDGHSDSGVARTRDGGSTWEKQASPAWMGYVFALKIDPADSRTLYGAGESVFFKSTDGGVSWTPVQNGYYGAGKRILARGKTVHVASVGGIFRSVNAGGSFAPGHKGIRASEVVDFALAPAATGNRTGSAATLYAGVDGYGLFKSTNGGSAWAKVDDFPGSDRPVSVAAAKTDARRVYFTTYNNLFPRVSRSLDGGTTFEPALQGAGCLNLRLSVAPSDPNRVLAAGHLGPGYSGGVAGLYLSSNGGMDWTEAQLSTVVGTFADTGVYAPSRPSTIYAAARTAAGTPTVLRSLNGGKAWTKVGAPTDPDWTVSTISGLAVHPTKPNTLYAATWFPGIYKSMNGGASWIRLKNGPNGGSCVALNPSAPEEVFVGDDAGIFFSADGGASWTDFSAGLAVKNVVRIEVDGPARLVYAGIRGGGIWRRGF